MGNDRGRVEQGYEQALMLPQGAQSCSRLSSLSSHVSQNASTGWHKLCTKVGRMQRPSRLSGTLAEPEVFGKEALHFGVRSGESLMLTSHCRQVEAVLRRSVVTDFVLSNRIWLWLSRAYADRASWFFRKALCLRSAELRAGLRCYSCLLCAEHVISRSGGKVDVTHFPPPLILTIISATKPLVQHHDPSDPVQLSKPSKHPPTSPSPFL